VEPRRGQAVGHHGSSLSLLDYSHRAAAASKQYRVRPSAGPDLGPQAPGARSLANAPAGSNLPRGPGACPTGCAAPLEAPEPSRRRHCSLTLRAEIPLRNQRRLIAKNNGFAPSGKFRVSKQRRAPRWTQNSNEYQWRGIMFPAAGAALVAAHCLAAGGRPRGAPLRRPRIIPIAPSPSSKNPERFPARAQIASFNFLNTRFARLDQGRRRSS
jgi:hypothetical protein